MYQKDTIHFGETSKNNTELNESAHIVTYEDIPYIDLKIKKFNMSFKVPGDVAKYLSDINSSKPCVNFDLILKYINECCYYLYLIFNCIIFRFMFTKKHLFVRLC